MEFAQVRSNPSAKPDNEVARAVQARQVALGRIGAMPSWLLFWIFGLILIGADLADGQVYFADIDDRMRILQIRDLLADGEWFDRTLAVIAMPAPYVSPWSRLVDLPYALIAESLSPFFGVSRAIAVAIHIWPPLMLAGFCIFCVIIMRRIGGGLLPLALAVAALAMTYAIWQFSPALTDHHNAQLVLMVAMLAGLCQPGWRGGALAGVAATLSVAVGLECVPFIVAAFGVHAIAAILGNEEARRQLSAGGVAMAAAAPLAGLMLIGPAAMVQAACDAWSAPWIAATAFGGAVLAATGTRMFAISGPITRLALLGVAAGVLVACLAVAFSQCLAGPFSMVDAVSHAFWLGRVEQEKGIRMLLETRRYDALAQLCLAASILAGSLPRIVAMRRREMLPAVLVWCVGVSALLLTVVEFRFMRFLPAFVPLLLPLLIGAPRGATAKPLAVGIALPAVLAGLLLAAVPAQARRYDAVDFMRWDRCDGADFSVLSMLAPGKIMAPLGLSMPIAESASGHSVAALPFHRAAPGIRRMAQAFTTREADVRRKALAPFDYVAVCARPLPNELDGAPLYLALAGGKSWPGLADVGDNGGNGLRVLRIDHEALR